MLKSNGKELIQAKKLMKEGKLEETLQLINEFRKEKALSHDEKISYYLLKSSLSQYLFQNQDILNYAEKASQESQNLGISLQVLDVYIQMAMGLIYRFKSEETLEFLVKAEDILKMLTKEPLTELLERQASMVYIKAWFYDNQNEKEKALEYAQRGLEMREKIDHKTEIGISLWQIGWIYFMSDNDLALKYVDHCIEYCEKINYKICIQKCTMLKGLIYLWRGELDPALEYFKLSKTLLDELSLENNDEFGAAQLFHLIGTVYQEKNKLDRATEYFKRALVIKEKVGAYYSKVLTLDEYISLALYKGDLKEAETNLKEMKRISDQEDNKFLKLCYRINKAKLLKLSPLRSDQMKAEEILKNCLEDKLADNETKIFALLNLCGLLLVKLRKTNNIKLIGNILLYINRIHNIAMNQGSFSLLAETYLLQAKLELLNLDLKGAQKFLNKARDIAEKYGLDRLKMRILIEQNELVTQIDDWEKVKASNSTIEELINLARIEDQLTRMLRKRFIFKKII